MLFGKKNKEQKIILFDFRSSSVAASVISLGKNNEKPKILYCKRDRYYFSETPTPEQFIYRAHISLKKLIKEINNFKIPNPEIENEISGVHVLLGSPWYNPSFIDVYYEQTKDFTITNSLLNKITENTVSKSIAENAHLEIIERNISTILVNGYENENFLGKKTKDLRLCYYISKVATETKDDIEKIIKQSLNTDEITFHTHVNTLHTFIRNYFQNVNNYVLLDVSGEMTEMTIVRNSLFKNNVTIPLGSHLFSRKLAEKSGYDLYTAWSHLNLIVDEKLGARLKKKAQTVFESIKDEYLDLIKETFIKEKIINIPSRIFVVADDEAQKLVKTIFESPEGYAGALKISKKPEIISFTKESFKNLSDYDIGVKNDNIMSIFSNFVRMYR